MCIRDRGQPDAVIGEPPLGEVISADTLGAVAGANLAAAICVDGVLLSLLLLLQQAAAQYLQGFVLVFVLAALVLAFHHHAGGQVGHPDGAGGLVDVLAACAGGTEGIDLQIVHIQLQVHLFRLGHDRHSDGGGVNAALRCV